MNILNEHEEESKTIIRRLEKLRKKEINARFAIVFNQQCLDNNLLPAYTNVRLHNEATRRKKFTTDFRRQLIEDQLNEKETVLTSLTKQIARRQEQYDYLELNEDINL